MKGKTKARVLEDEDVTYYGIYPGDYVYIDGYICFDDNPMAIVVSHKNSAVGQVYVGNLEIVSDKEYYNNKWK